MQRTRCDGGHADLIAGSCRKPVECRKSFPVRMFRRSRLAVEWGYARSAVAASLITRLNS
jgi:hypothetical protein